MKRPAYQYVTYFYNVNIICPFLFNHIYFKGLLDILGASNTSLAYFLHKHSQTSSYLQATFSIFSDSITSNRISLDLFYLHVTIVSVSSALW